MINKIPLYVLNNYLKFEKKIYQVFGLKLGRPLRMKAVLYGIVFGVGTIVFYNLPYLGNLINWMPKGVLVLLPIGLAWLLADVGTENRSPIFFFRSFIGYQVRNRVSKKTYYRGKEIPKETVYQFRNYFTYTVSNGEVNMLEEMTAALPKANEQEHSASVTPKNKESKPSVWKRMKEAKEVFARQRQRHRKPGENKTSFIPETSREETIGIQLKQESTDEVEVHPEEAPAQVNEVFVQVKTKDVQEKPSAFRTHSPIYCEESELPVQTPYYEEPKQPDAARMAETVIDEAAEKESQRLTELEQKVMSLQKLMEGNMREQAKEQESVGKAFLPTLKPPNPLIARRKKEKRKEEVKKEVFELLSLSPIKSETSSEEKS